MSVYVFVCVYVCAGLLHLSIIVDRLMITLKPNIFVIITSWVAIVSL